MINIDKNLQVSPVALSRDMRDKLLSIIHDGFLFIQVSGIPRVATSGVGVRND